MSLDLKSDAVLLGLGVVGVLLIANNAKSIGQAAVGAVTDAAAGGVIGIGQAVGIPATNRTQCQIDIDNGDVWAASFSCPLGDFLAFKKSWEK